MKKKITIHCPYCGAKATLHPASYVYGEASKTENMLYVCDRYPKCDSYVTAHQKQKSRWAHWQTGLSAIRESRRTKLLTGCGNPGL